MVKLSERDYQTKLLHALLHPLSEVRMRAIIALGMRRNPIAADALFDCALRHPKDVVEGLEIVASLALLQPHSAGHAALCRLAARHPAHAVRSAAKKALLREPARDEPEERDD